MTIIEFKSSENGSLLSFQKTNQWNDEIEFEVSVRTHHFSGKSTATTFINGSPSSLFNEMAKDWRGWHGTKTWSDLESKVAINASIDALGHVTLEIKLQGTDHVNYLHVCLLFDAGQLEDMANQITELLG
jgi:hypothetical protein